MYATLRPTQEIELAPDNFNPLVPAKATIAKKRLAAARPGDQPWVTFRFFYRTQCWSHAHYAWIY